MRRGKSPHIFILLLLVATLFSAPLILSTPNWHAVAPASASTSGDTGSITVTSKDFDTGAALSGFTVDVRLNGNPVQNGFTPVTFSGLQTGVQYQVVAYWYGNYYFRQFSDGNLNRYALVTLNATQNSVSLTGLYQHVPASQAATLNILAQFPNGTQLGTTFNNTDYIQHTPGMWLTVTPPGSAQPFTGSYTGGSILPFILFSGQTYTVDMTAGYGNVQFLHWKDNNSPSLSRQVQLSGNASYTAIYFVNASAAVTTTTTSSTTSQTSSSSSTTAATSSTSASTTTSSTTTTASSSSTSASTTTLSASTTATSSSTSTSTAFVTLTTTSPTTSATTTTTTTASTFAAPEFPVGPAPAFVVALIGVLLLLSAGAKRLSSGRAPWWFVS